jgi:hypothetical protein
MSGAVRGEGAGPLHGVAARGGAVALRWAHGWACGGVVIDWQPGPRTGRQKNSHGRDEGGDLGQAEPWEEVDAAPVGAMRWHGWRRLADLSSGKRLEVEGFRDAGQQKPRNQGLCPGCWGCGPGRGFAGGGALSVVCPGLPPFRATSQLPVSPAHGLGSKLRPLYIGEELESGSLAQVSSRRPTQTARTVPLYR